MKTTCSSLIDSALWALVVYLLLHLPTIEMRVDDLEQPAPREQPPMASTQRPEPAHQRYLKLGKCFHMPRDECPPPGSCKKVGDVSVFCCDLDSARLKDALSDSITQNTTYLHVLNASIDELDLSQAVFRRLASMALTDGDIGKISGQFPKHSPIACLNISSNNLTTAKLPSLQRPFAYLYNLTVLDASANDLTEFPLSLVHSNKKISVDLSGELRVRDWWYCGISKRLASEVVLAGSRGCRHEPSGKCYRYKNLMYDRTIKFPKPSCLNISSNNLTTAKLPSLQRPFAYLYNLTVLDASANDLTEFPLSLVHSNKKISVDLSGELQDYQFPEPSCLNISSNNLTTAKLPSLQRPFAYLYNLTVLDASANDLTEFPLSLVHSNKKISVDLSGNNYLPCKHFQRAMDANNSSLVTFLHYNQTFCALDLQFNWFKDVQVVQIDHLKIQKELNANCRKIKPAESNCSCVFERLELMGDEVTNLVAVDCSQRHLTEMPTNLPPNTVKLNVSYNNTTKPAESNCSCVFERLELMGDEVTNLVAVDCSQRHLTEMPTNLPPNTVKLNVSYNNITSLQAVGDDPTYEHLRQLFADYNDVSNIIALEGTKFIDNFMLFSIGHNKLKTIHTYVLSNRFGTTGPKLSIAGNKIVCDCNAEKMIKPWLQENFKNIPDYKNLECQDNLGPVVDLVESKVCHTPRDWTDYIYYIIGLEVLVLVLLISKVSYDYWIFKTAGYLPWPANKMPRLPCDWLCE
ncbi:protein halfway [Ostrinia nubilalis]|uniref:protein halfway n=1 Tax=Ostrinia nubilalis TaxID=29057 RepID=UPI0030825383